MKIGHPDFECYFWRDVEFRLSFSLPRHVRYSEVSRMIQKTELTWATTNTGNLREMADFIARQECLAGERAKAAFERLKALGIIDEHGDSIGDELPPDMIPGAERDFGG